MGNRATAKGKPRVQVDPPEGSRVDVVSPNWCDKTTWYANSVVVQDETLVDSGDGLTFNSANENWIDTTHGKLTDEDTLSADCVPVVKANSVEKTIDAPFGVGGDGDFSINYGTGSVTFHSAPALPVTASYRHQNGSEWTVKPKAGKCLRLTTVEVQFSRNAELKDTVIFQAYGFVEHFAPSLLDTATPPGPYPAGTLIPIGTATTYKTMMDYINDASGAFPEIPAMGGTPRGTSQPIQIFQWPYDKRASTDLCSATGMEIRISLESNQVFSGDFAVATFYGISEDE